MTNFDFEPQPWQVLQSDKLLDYSPWLKVICQTVRLPNGVIIPNYLLTPGRDYSLIVALTDHQEVLLVRQYKHGLGRAVLDFPAGYLDAPNEDPQLCAQRELLEETGHTARAWTALGAFCIDSNRAATAAHLFLARGLEQVAPPHLDATENLRHYALPAHQIPELLHTGQLPNVACAAAWGLAAPLLTSA